MTIIDIELPLDLKSIKMLKVGDRVHLNGFLYTGRDAAHKRMISSLKKMKSCPLSY